MAAVHGRAASVRSVSSIVTADLDGNGRDDLVMNFPGYGVWGYLNGATWIQIHGTGATRLAAGDLDGNGMSDLVVDFGATYGVWVLQQLVRPGRRCTP